MREMKNHPAKEFRLYESDEFYLQKLSDDVRKMLELATNDGLNYEAIADIMGGLKIGTIKSRLNRARTKILKMRASETTQAEAVHV